MSQHQWVATESLLAGAFRFCEVCDREEWATGVVRQGANECQSLCPTCGDALNLHIGGKPCVSARLKTQEQRQREASERTKSRQIRRLYGPDAH